MPSGMLYRLSGIALLLGTLLTALFSGIDLILFGVNPLSYLLAGHDLTMLSRRLVELVTGPLWLPVNLVIFFGSMALVAGLPGMYTCLAKRVGWLGLIGFVLTMVAVLLGGVVNLALYAFVLPVIAPQVSHLPPAGHPRADLEGFYLIASLLFSLGAFSFGLAILNAGTLLHHIKVTGAVLIVAAVCNVVHLMPLPEDMWWLIPIGNNAGTFSFLLGLAAFGYTLVSLPVAEAVQSSPISTEKGLGMSPAMLYRLSGLALLVGTLFAIPAGINRWEDLTGATAVTLLASPLFVPEYLMGLIGAMLILLGLPGLFVYVVRPMRWSGLIGFILIYCSTLMLGVADMGLYSLGLPLLAILAPPDFTGSSPYLPLPAPPVFYLVALLALCVGVMLFGRAMIRAAVLPQDFDGIGWTLMLAGLFNALAILFAVTITYGLWPLFVLSLFFSFVVFFLALAVSGGVLLARSAEAGPMIGRPLIHGMLTSGVAASYVLAVGSIGVLLQQTRITLIISLFSIGLIAILFQPLRDRLQRAVNHLVYGERDNPYAVLSRLGRHMEATLVPEAVLPTIVETVAQTLKLPYAAITFKQQDEETIVASYGSAKEELIRFPLIYQSERIGALLLASRSAGEPLTPADYRLLNDLARQVGSAAYSVRVTMDLQHLTTELLHSRTQLVTAREEERRRLRRDLHDGLGSVLAALNWRAGAIRLALAHDPAAAETLVVEQQRTIRAAIADIRRLVYELRPPALDELGLVGAIRERAAQYSRYHARSGEREEPGELRVEVWAPDTLLTLPAAIEVVVYRIVQEALANVVRHAHAQTCGIRLTLEQEQLLLEVTDDGVGLGEAHHVGVGLLSMRERAEELGGTCDISSAIKGGTCVRVCLPLPKE